MLGRLGNGKDLRHYSPLGRGANRTMRSFIKWFLMAVCVGLVLAISFGVVGEFFIELAREKGFYTNPSQKLDDGVRAVSDFVTQSWLLYSTVGVVCLTLGMWMDVLLRRRERAAPAPAPPLQLEPQSKSAKAVGENCLMIASDIDYYLSHLELGQTNQINVLWSKYLPVALDLEKLGLPTPDVTPNTTAALAMIRDYLQFIGRLLYAGHVEVAKETAERLCTPVSDPSNTKSGSQQLPGTAGETPQ